MVEESERYIPAFHQRFSIKVDIDEAQQRFMSRIINSVSEQLPSLERSDPGNLQSADRRFREKSLRRVALKSGKQFLARSTLSYYIEGNLSICLQALEALHEAWGDKGKTILTELIGDILTMSEVDLEIEWRDGAFWPSGAKLLDEALVNENLKWLSDRGYQDVVMPFEKGLRHFLEARREPGRLADTVTDVYEAVEALAKVVTGKDRDLTKNAELFVSKLNLSDYYKKMFKDYIDYGCDYRHAPKLAKKRPPLKHNEVEAFIYTSGLFIRLAIQQLA